MDHRLQYSFMSAAEGVLSNWATYECDETCGITTQRHTRECVADEGNDPSCPDPDCDTTVFTDEEECEQPEPCCEPGERYFGHL